MMLDTNALIWMVREPQRLPKAVHDRIADPDERRCLSVVSFWEMCIKHRKGKLPLPAPFALDPVSALNSWLARAVIDLVPLAPQHAALAMRLPFASEDPFDRLIAATAIVENEELVTGDGSFTGCPGLRVLRV